MLKHANWEVLRDQVALAIYIKECAEVDIPREEAELRWAAMPDLPSQVYVRSDWLLAHRAPGSLSRRVQLTLTAGFALMALEEAGWLTAPGPRAVKAKRNAAG